MINAYNPFLPINEYIPDGEPHVFNGRVYHYGSHDKEGGYTFCMLDYVCYSAPVDNLKEWRYEGVIYKASNDPDYDTQPYMYAPDVVQGNDGRYYLYYCTGGDYGYGGYSGPIKVAVCDSPCGEFKYLGMVRNKDGSPMEKYICFDPAALNDDGVIRIYYGTQYDYEERPDFETNESLLLEEVNMFNRSKEEILSYKDSIMGAVMVVLDDDMLTVKEEARHIIPYRVKGTSFEGHPFFEGSSMRKVNDKYYFIYSSWQNHELCYATSDYPDRDFTFGGTIVSNGDVGFNGRESANKLNMTGTTHGSICEINGSWYVFYHRLTHKSDYSRQACAEPIVIENDGSIKQVSISSCGLNGGPISTPANIPAVCACNITNGHMPHGSNSIYTHSFPNVNHKDDDRFIAELRNGCIVGYKYIEFSKTRNISLNMRVEDDSTKPVYEGPVRLDERCINEDRADDTCVINDEGYVDIYISNCPDDGVNVIPVSALLAGRIDLTTVNNTWQMLTSNIDVPDGTYSLYLKFGGKGIYQLKDVVCQ